MNPELSIPPRSQNDLTPPTILAERLSFLLGTPFSLSRKTRTDGSNARKRVASALEEYSLPPACPENQYAIIPPKKKGVPRILREYIDTYIVTTGETYNLQVWNRNPTEDSVQIEYASGERLSAKDVRFVFVRVDPIAQVVRSVLVLTPEYIEQHFGRFGKPTIKHQLIISAKTRTEILQMTPPLLYYPDTPHLSDFVSSAYKQPNLSIHNVPVVGDLMSLDTLKERLIVNLIGKRIELGSTKTRGQALELLVAQTLGYQPSDTELLAGGYPDIRHQLLEVKIQDSPTVDLGMFTPQFEEPVPSFPQATTSDVRYLIALMNVTTGIIQGIVLCPGSQLGQHFTYVANTSYKCQRSIPMSFFDQYDGQAVFNP